MRFIAYLGCNHTIPDKILHDCIKTLLSCKPGNAKFPSKVTPVGSNVSTGMYYIWISSVRCFSGYPQEDGSLALDMECLCQLLKIAGRHLDSEKARNLMNQYFERLQRILDRASPDFFKSGNGKFVPLSTRIRFLIWDTIELRENKWVPLFDDQQQDSGHPWFLSDLKRELDMASSGESLNNLGSSSFIQETESNHRVNGDSFDKDNDWTKLNRLGKALCTRGREMDLFSNVELSTNASQRNADGFHNNNNSSNNRRNGFNYQGCPKRCQTPQSQYFYQTYNNQGRCEFDSNSNGSSGSSCGNNVAAWSRRGVPRNVGGQPAHISRFCHSPPAGDKSHYPKLSINNGKHYEVSLVSRKRYINAGNNLFRKAVFSAFTTYSNWLTGSRILINQIIFGGLNWRHLFSLIRYVEKGCSWRVYAYLNIDLIYNHKILSQTIIRTREVWVAIRRPNHF